MSGYYESDLALWDYLLFHYGSAEQVLPYPFGPFAALHYPVRCVTECLDTSALPGSSRALDLGCGVGRSSFELARHCHEVVAIDYSRKFVDAARLIQLRGEIQFRIIEEGERTTGAIASLPGGLDPGRVRFEQGDAMALPGDLGEFEVVLMANLIDRLAEPRRCLAQLDRLTKPRAQLIITSPYTWTETYTPRKHWLGGGASGDRNRTTLEELQEILAPHFDLTRRKDLPFLIREHARKFQWSVAEATIWRRRD